MSWDEFLTLLCGINSDTPLGHIVSIRSEKNASRIKEFTPEQRKIRNEWLAKHKKINTNKEDYDRAMARLTSYFRTL